MKQTVRRQIADIALDVSWAKIARKYFGKSSSWMYRKLDGTEEDFSDEEKLQFKNALLDLSERIRIVAENLE